MIPSFTILYALLFSLVVNGFLLFDSVFLLIVCCLVFLGLNGACGLFLPRESGIRLRVLNHGTMALICFCISAVVSAVLHALAWFGVLAVSRSTLLHSAVYCVICNAILFWNGIICVYLTSVQLGIKTRVVGLVCGLIPIANLVVLGIIIDKTYREFQLERKKENINKARRGQKICQTKYPILFVHGVFFRDNKFFNYWGRIPKELETNGALCFYGNHSSAASVRNSGEELARRIREITEQTGCEKVNIIAHSKGGLDCRYALAHCGVADCVASLTTVSTPHRGCAFAQWLLEKAPEAVQEEIASTYNHAAKIAGDTHPDFMAAVRDLTAEVCREFDENTALPSGVYGQSVGSVMKKARSGRFPLNVSYRFVKLFDGRNDGLVGVDSFQWGEKYTLLDLPVRRGISHADMIDLNRENLKGFDVREFYVNLIMELKEKGL